MHVWITVVAANQSKALGSLVHSGIIGPDGNYVVRVPNQGERLFVGDIST